MFDFQIEQKPLSSKPMTVFSKHMIKLHKGILSRQIAYLPFLLFYHFESFVKWHGSSIEMTRCKQCESIVLMQIRAVSCLNGDNDKIQMEKTIIVGERNKWATNVKMHFFPFSPLLARHPIAVVLLYLLTLCFTL